MASCQVGWELRTCPGYSSPRWADCRRFLSEAGGTRFQGSAADPFNLAGGQPWADYYNFKDEWNDGSCRRTRGPQRLSGRILCDCAADPGCTVPPWTTDFSPSSDWMYLPYGFTHGNPRGFDGTTSPGMAPCSHHYSTVAGRWQNLSDCFQNDGTDTGFTLRVPFDINRQYGGNVPLDNERFAEQHYNATLAVADQARSQRGTFYVIGLGQRTPGMVTNARLPIPTKTQTARIITVRTTFSLVSHSTRICVTSSNDPRR